MKRNRKRMMAGVAVVAALILVAAILFVPSGRNNSFKHQLTSRSQIENLAAGDYTETPPVEDPGGAPDDSNQNGANDDSAQNGASDEPTPDGASDDSAQSGDSGATPDAEPDAESDAEPQQPDSGGAPQQAPNQSSAEDTAADSAAEPGAPQAAAYQDGSVTVNGVVYECYSSGEATLSNASSASGNFVVPKEITGPGGETYLVTKIGTYYDSNASRERGAFVASNITGLSFEAGSQLYYIVDGAFSSCYSLAGADIVLPDTMTYVGRDAFALYENEIGLGSLAHPHLAYVSGALPSLDTDDPPLTVPQQSKEYESVVDSTHKNTTLHKAASWTNDELTEAEIRIDYGKSPNYNGKVDFIFVLDYSSSMLITASVTNASGVECTYPRSLLMNDIVYSASQTLLDTSIPGYDNRVALVAFGDEETPLWTLDYTSDPAVVQDALFDNPLTLQNETNYGAGLSGAIDIINNRKDTSRTPVVIFLSDGEPNKGQGLSEATTLRNTMNVSVYPVAVYMSGADLSALRNISFDGNTAYDATDTNSFEKIIMEVVEKIVMQDVPLNISLQDILSDQFELATGTSADITVAPGNGSVDINGDTLTWDLAGCDSSVIHSIIIKAKLKSGTELSASGALPTNASLGATDGSITSSSQPELERYLVHYVFENGNDPTQPLPDEIMALLPSSERSYRTGADVTAAAPSQTLITLEDGDQWTFGGWDVEKDTIDKADVTFTGVWRSAFAGFTFTKTDGRSTGLPGAEFDLYYWEGSSAPAGGDAYVTAQNTAPGKWTKTNAQAITSASDGVVDLSFQAGGFYQLIETKAPDGFLLPNSQWRLTVDATAGVTYIETIPESGSAAVVSFTKIAQPGGDLWNLPNFSNQFTLSFLKLSSEHYHDGVVSAQALQGAEFKLYVWTAAGAPTDADLVSADTIQQGNWKEVGAETSQSGGEVNFSFTAKAAGYYQLVETRAPENYQLPKGQWRLTFYLDGSVDTIRRIDSADAETPPPFEPAESGEFAGKLALTNIPNYELPAMGGGGKWPFILGGLALLLTGLIIALSRHLAAKKRHPARFLNR